MCCYKLSLTNIKDINYVCLLTVCPEISSSILVMINGEEVFNYCSKLNLLQSRIGLQGLHVKRFNRCLKLY